MSSVQVKFSPAAEIDLENIWFYTFENWSSEQADKYTSQILSASQELADGLKAGRKTPIRDGYFKYKTGSHMLFYKSDRDSLFVVRVLHQSMDFERHL